jgi:hypothetical protein
LVIDLGGQIVDVKNDDGSGDKYEDQPSDEEEVRLRRHLTSRSCCWRNAQDVHVPEVPLRIATDLRAIGTKLFKDGKYDLAYKKCMSFLVPRSISEQSRQTKRASNTST